MDISSYFLEVPPNPPEREFTYTTLVIDPGNYTWQAHSADAGNYIVDSDGHSDADQHTYICQYGHTDSDLDSNSHSYGYANRDGYPHSAHPNSDNDLDPHSIAHAHPDPNRDRSAQQYRDLYADTNPDTHAD